MVDMADQLTANGVPVYRDSTGVLREYSSAPSGEGSAAATPQVGVDRDTDGNPVPTYKMHTYTYDTSGNLVTDTVSDGSFNWTRTYTYQNGVMNTDSGWVKQ